MDVQKMRLRSAFFFSIGASFQGGHLFHGGQLNTSSADQGGGDGR